jgi:hypothetical protein
MEVKHRNSSWLDRESIVLLVVFVVITIMLATGTYWIGLR